MCKSMVLFRDGEMAECRVYRYLGGCLAGQPTCYVYRGETVVWVCPGESVAWVEA